jgi:hypothetical protein
MVWWACGVANTVLDRCVCIDMGMKLYCMYIPLVNIRYLPQNAIFCTSCG